ncbi:MAG: lipid-A-disaccharide synthase [Burkholderiales bacterium]|jgi:lipid-A-disaccharide synthase
MVAGEASGDLLGAHLIAALSARRPELRFAGIGGPKMQAEGFESLYPMEKLSVRGYAEVLRHYREIAGIRRHFASRLLEDRPAIFIGVDAPDFNLDLERSLKGAGIPTVHYVSPSIWAWRAGRMGKISAAVSHMLTLFPFEAPLYEKAGVPVTYVGHPLADLIPLEVNKDEARAQLRLPKRHPIIALLPGSRKSELHYMAETFVKTARRLYEEFKEIHFVCPMATRETRDLFETAVRYHAGGELPLTLLFGHSHEALAAADVALVASGTASLEAALFKTPMVVAYRMSPLTWALMRHMIRLPYVGLPNILADEPLVAEFLQGRATPGALSAAIIELMHDADRQRRQVARFRQIHLNLRQNTAEKAADAVLRVLDSAHG